MARNIVDLVRMGFEEEADDRKDEESKVFLSKISIFEAKQFFVIKTEISQKRTEKSIFSYHRFR